MATDMPTAATAAYFAATSDGAFDHQRDAYEQGYEDGGTAERAKIREAFPRHKVEWLIHTLDLIDKLAKSRGMDTSTEAQDDLRRLADILDGTA